MKFRQTLTERQCEFGHRAGSKSLIPVIVPMYLESNIMESVDITGICLKWQEKKSIWENGSVKIRQRRRMAQKIKRQRY